nr:MAG TPA: hypothetical protein [Caudoviricetes sp.]
MRQKIYNFLMNDWVLSILFALELILGIFYFG